MFVKPLVLTLGLLYVANKFYLGRGILVENMMIVPRRNLGMIIRTRRGQLSFTARSQM